jgi:hypothetical protein
MDYSIIGSVFFFRPHCLADVSWNSHTLLPSLASLIFALLGIAQTSLPLHTLIAKIWLELGQVRLGKCEALTNTIEKQ